MFHSIVYGSFQTQVETRYLRQCLCNELNHIYCFHFQFKDMKHINPLVGWGCWCWCWWCGRFDPGLDSKTENSFMFTSSLSHSIFLSNFDIFCTRKSKCFQMKCCIQSKKSCIELVSVDDDDDEGIQSVNDFSFRFTNVWHYSTSPEMNQLMMMIVVLDICQQQFTILAFIPIFSNSKHRTMQLFFSPFITEKIIYLFSKGSL